MLLKVVDERGQMRRVIPRYVGHLDEAEANGVLDIAFDRPKMEQACRMFLMGDIEADEMASRLQAIFSNILDEMNDPQLRIEGLDGDDHE